MHFLVEGHHPWMDSLQFFPYSEGAVPLQYGFNFHLFIPQFCYHLHHKTFLLCLHRFPLIIIFARVIFIFLFFSSFYLSFFFLVFFFCLVKVYH